MAGLAVSGNDYFTLGDSGVTTVGAVEANASVTYRSAGTFSYLSANLASVSTSPAPIHFRVGGANGNQVLSCTGGGIFTDVSHTDVITAGTAVDVLVSGSGTTPTLYGIEVLFAASSGTVKKLCLGNATTALSAASTTTYFPICGALATSSSTTETNVENKLYVNGTLRNLFGYVSVNTSTNATTLGTRIATANGNCSVSIAGSSTGSFEDIFSTTGDSDTVSSSGTIVDYYVTTGTGTVSITFRTIGIELTTTDNSSVVASGGDPSSVSGSGGLNESFAFGGIALGNTTAQGNPSLTPFTLSELTVNLASNGLNVAPVFALKGNNTYTSSISVTMSATGFFTDVTHSDNIPTSETGLYYNASCSSTSGTFKMVTTSAKIQMLEPDEDFWVNPALIPSDPTIVVYQ
jgi:hypothetical protein